MQQPQVILPFAISRSKVDLFRDCPRCCYLDLVKKISRPPGFPFTLNNAVDTLLKKEFDLHRIAQTVHPAILAAGYDFLPYQGPEIDGWRAMKKGIRATYRGVEFYGLVDDVWQDNNGYLMIVDYKATAKQQPVTQLDNHGFHLQYKKQLEFYAWLLKQNGYPVSTRAWILYYTGNSGNDSFNSNLEFEGHLIEHACDESWIVPVLDEMIATLSASQVPPSSNSCAFCNYHEKRMTV